MIVLRAVPALLIGAGTAVTHSPELGVLVAITVGIMTGLAILIKGTWTVFGAVNIQIEATRHNTQAIENLDKRLERLEKL